MKALVLADLQWVDIDEWHHFLKIDQASFDCIFVLGDINQILLEQLSQVFREKRFIGVHGDFGFPGDLEYYGMENCHGRVVLYGTKRIAGVEGSNRYKKGPYPMHTQEEIKAVCNQLEKADVLLCHNTPSGYYDQKDHPVYQGFQGILDYMNEKKPRYLFHGHYHVNTEDQHEETLLIGVFGGIIYDFDTDERVTVLQQSM